MERLNKIIARAGAASRRGADQLILEGKVKIDGEIVKELGVKVDPKKQKISVKNKPLFIQTKKQYFILNKPRGYICTAFDPEGRRTVFDLVKVKGLFSVGRLDLNTEGVLLLTNDGELSNKLLHPRYKIKKTYQAKLQGIISNSQVAKLVKGVSLVDGRVKAHFAKVIKRTHSNSWVEITISEGKKHIIKRMFEQIGFNVVKLKRIDFAGLRLKELGSGQYRELTAYEIKRLIPRPYAGQASCLSI